MAAVRKIWDMLRALIESCEAAGDLIKRLVDCLTAIADCKNGRASPQGVECLMGVMAGLLGTLVSAAILAALKFNLFDKLKDLICGLKAKIRNALRGVMQKILEWIKKKFTPQRIQKPGEPAPAGLCPLPKPPVSKNKLPKQAKPKKPAKKGGGCGRSAMVPAGNCFPGDALAQLPDGFRRLDEIAAGDRLTTYNHAERDHFEETAETRIDPDTWRLVTIRQDQGEAGTIEADLLRPLGFFGGQWPNPGDEFNLDLPGLGLSGPVEVTAIAACPIIPPGPGRIVLSVFRHSRGSTGTLHLSGHPEPIRVTPLHPIWSPSHDDLDPGRSIDGTPQCVALEIGVPRRPLRVGCAGRAGVQCRGGRRPLLPGHRTRTVGTQPVGSHAGARGSDGCGCRNACRLPNYSAVPETARQGKHQPGKHQLTNREEFKAPIRCVQGRERKSDQGRSPRIPGPLYYLRRPCRK